jgi:hypothetical protein
MANRSYLYAIDAVPAIDSSPSESRCIGISEFNGAIPIVFKLLLTGNPRACRSIIWKTPDEIALVGEYALGFQRLKEFLARIDLPAAQPLIQECLDFLEDNKHRRNYFLLECGEIFELTEEPLDQQNAKLLNEITDLDAEIDQALERVKATIVNGPRSEGLPPNLSAAAKELDAEVEGLFGGLLPPEKRSRLRGVVSEFILSRVARHTDPLDQVYRLGLGHWSTSLYYGIPSEG